MLQVEFTAFTVADYYSLPESVLSCQLIDGELHMAPSPNRFHQQILTNLVRIIATHVKARQLGKLYAAPFDVELTDHDVYQPDLGFFSNEYGMKHLTEHGAKGAPDLVVEILSPKTSRYDLGVKKDIYAQTGVREIWLADPETLTIAVHRYSEQRELVSSFTLGVKETLETPLLPGLAIPVAEVFAD